MGNADNWQSVNAHWSREGLGQSILDALVSAGKRLDALTLEDLAPVDQYHSGGIGATTALADLAEISPGARVLDVGGGLGGPARTLASRHGSRVTVLDLSESYVQAGENLTGLIGHSERVKHRVGNALELPFDDETFDVIWTQQSGMNIPDKERLYQGFFRVLVPGGMLAFQEYVAGPVQPIIYPVMWARDDSTSFLSSPDELRSVIEDAGFRTRVWNDVTSDTSRQGSTDLAYSIQALVMGDDLPAIRAAGRRNDEEDRVLRVQAVFDRL